MWSAMQVERPPGAVGSPVATLDVESDVDEHCLSFTFLTTAHTPDGVEITLTLVARWPGEHYQDWSEVEIERFLVDHAAGEAFERIDNALRFFSGEFDTPVPLFSPDDADPGR